MDSGPTVTRRLPAAIVLFAGIAAALNIGKLPPALAPLQEAFGMTLLEASFLVSAFQVAGMTLGLFGGLLADRFGPRRLMAAGLLLLAVASAAGATTSHALGLVGLRVVESAGFILTVLPGPALLRRLVRPANLGLALGGWSCYMPAGMASALVLSPWILERWGWATLWLLCAGAAAVVAALLLVWVPADPLRGAEGAPVVRVRALASDTLRAPGPWLLALCFGLYAGQFIAVFGFLPTAYRDAGIAPGLAGSLTALGVAVNILGNVLSGRLVQHGVGRARLLAGTSVVMAGAAVVAFGSELPFGARYGAVLVLSAVGGIIPGTLFTTAPRFAPYAGAVSTTTGLMQQGSALGQFVSPPLVAAVAAGSGGWHHTWWVTSGFALANVIVALAIGRLDGRIGTGTRREAP